MGIRSGPTSPRPSLAIFVRPLAIVTGALVPCPPDRTTKGKHYDTFFGTLVRPHGARRFGAGDDCGRSGRYLSGRARVPCSRRDHLRRHGVGTTDKKKKETRK